MVVRGARSAAVIDWPSGLALGADGDPPGADHETGCAEIAELARLAAENTVFAPPPATTTPPHQVPVEDLVVTTGDGYHLVRFVDTGFDSSVFLYLWLDRGAGNLALARIRLRELAGRLVLA